VVLPVVLWRTWFLTASAGVADNQKRRDAAAAELSATPVPAPTSAQSSALQQQKVARVTALSSALGGRLAWDRVLREFALVLPDDVWLLNLSAAAPTPAATVAADPTSSSSTSSTPTPGGTLGFNIEGYTYPHDAVARLLSRLAVGPDLEHVQLGTSEVSKVGTRTIIHFKIAAAVRAPGAGS